ncbi:MAG: hypothetical protein ACREQO_05180 [Candidatus Binatia bacterium]
MSTLVGRVAFVAVFLAAAQLAWGQSDDKAKQIEAAKKDGKLIWYTSNQRHRVQAAAG